MGVHESRGLFIFKCFVLHDVTPMTGAVANTDDDQLLLDSRFLPGVVPPRQPINGVVLVLLEVRRG